MDVLHRIGRPGKAILLLAAGVAGGGAALAIASVPDSSGVIHACVEMVSNPSAGGAGPALTAGNLRVIDPSATPPQTCTTTPGSGNFEQSISWNQTGPQGPAGTNGAPGAPGNTLTVNGEAFTLTSGRALTVVDQPVIAPLAVDPNAPPIGTVTLAPAKGNGRSTKFEIKDYSFGIENPTAAGTGGSGGGSGKVSVHDITITKTTDSASPILFQACVKGAHFPTVVLHVRKAGEKPSSYFTITLTNVLVSSYQSGGHSGDKLPVESVSLNFAKIKWDYNK